MTGRVRNVWAAAMGLAVLGVVAASPAAAASEPKCGPRQTLVRVDEKICPATARRPAVIVQRACCGKPNGKTRCKAFKKCPRRSPSA
ncbi:MAG TPA: hypothetical protein VGR62_18860 [Candidatus Binatia bacterium]|nr:hypothetical protein [Candidatus Binatia bacterium]